MSDESLHKKYLADLLKTRSELRTRGFRIEMNVVMELITGHEEWFKPRELMPRPDAFMIRFDQRVVEVYEVQVTHACSQQTLQEYADLDGAFEGNGSDWRVLLFVIDRYGRAHADPISLDQYRS
jgi:hypothetical protein